MFCAPNDGAVAVVLCSPKAANKYTTPRQVILASCAHRINPYPEMAVGNYFGYRMGNKPVTTLAAEEAYKKQESARKICRLWSCRIRMHRGRSCFQKNFSCSSRRRRAAVSDGVTEIGGRLPISTDGGIISKGEPVGASALGQIYEVVVQLRGEAGQRQVANAKTGLAHVRGALDTPRNDSQDLATIAA